MRDFLEWIEDSDKDYALMVNILTIHSSSKMCRISNLEYVIFEGRKLEGGKFFTCSLVAF